MKRMITALVLAALLTLGVVGVASADLQRAIEKTGVACVHAGQGLNTAAANGPSFCPDP